MVFSTFTIFLILCCILLCLLICVRKCLKSLTEMKHSSLQRISLTVSLLQLPTTNHLLQFYITKIIVTHFLKHLVVHVGCTSAHTTLTDLTIDPNASFLAIVFIIKDIFDETVFPFNSSSTSSHVSHQCLLVWAFL
jgi:hypothetical protein